MIQLVALRQTRALDPRRTSEHYTEHHQDLNTKVSVKYLLMTDVGFKYYNAELEQAHVNQLGATPGDPDSHM